MKKQFVQWGAIAGTALGACAAEVQTRPAIVYDTEPALVDVEPGVQVVENRIRAYPAGRYRRYRRQ